MARTKKQTIDAATARKRQIQEEIQNESLALLGKGETNKSASCEGINQNRGTVKSKHSGSADSSRENSLTRSSTDSPGCGKATDNNLDFPKAVICIPDIYKSSPELLDSASVKLNTNCGISKSPTKTQPSSVYGVLKHTSSESMDERSSMKHVPSPTTKTKTTSKAALDPSPEKEGKAVSPLRKASPKQHGRRSPRQRLSASAGLHHVQASPEEPGSAHKFEKPKINIFTDNLGVDLGKRIRSPRRLSEDMIALPIFSMRRNGGSPKEIQGSQKSQDAEYSIESPLKRSPPKAILPGRLNGKPKIKASHSHSSVENNSSDGEILKKKLKSQDRKSQSLTYKDSIFELKSEPHEILSSKGNEPNVTHKPYSAEKQNRELLMSSICKDVIGEVASQSGYLFKRVSKEREYSSIESQTKTSQGKSLETVTCYKINENDRVSDTRTVEVKMEDGVPLLNEEKSNNSKEQSSLLCAMLVGGTDVAQDYSQKKEKIKPETTDISNTDDKHSIILCSDKHPDNSQINDGSFVNKNQCEKDKQYKLKDENVSICITNTNDSTLQECEESLKDEIAKSEGQKENCNDDTDQKEDKRIEENSCVEDSERCESPRFSNEIYPDKEDNINDLDDSSSEVKDKKAADAWKKSKIDYSSQLKRLNENVLKLTDIDVEDQFLTLPDKCSNDHPVQSHGETELFSLISRLGLRLKDNFLKDPDSSDNDNNDIDHLLEECPKGRQNIISSDEGKWNKILERLKEEESMQEKGATGVSPDCCSKNESESKSTSCVNVNAIVGDSQGNYEIGAYASKKNITTSPLHLEQTNSDIEQSLPHAISSQSKFERRDLLKHSKQPLQKALTCSDLSSSLEPKVLRRVNSSPQLDKCVPSPSTSNPITTPHEEGEGSSKSKLGSKIPVPGTLFQSKPDRKSWRTPRIIMDPKPLEILTQLESDGPEKDIFVSSDLQKYLWLPSSRMIVNSVIREEIKLADETANSAWETKAMIMKEEEENLLKRDDDEKINLQFSKYEPDFDEVEGMLFMSFSSEIELKAHVHVERALEWDKDDTMLRISRAKIFEETKAVKGNMKEVKMKHLRGQHMRWKKYKRLYSKEVNTMLEAKENGVSWEHVTSFKKTSDITKIKGWKNKPALVRDPSPQDKYAESDHRNKNNLSVTIGEHSLPSYEESIEDSDYDISKSRPERLDERKRELSPKSRRRFNFSDQKAHRQLFKELKMDWEDRMIHRKLGGWSLKGNRPKAFSMAAIKRQKKELRMSPLNEKTNDAAFDNSMTEIASDTSPGPGGNMNRRKKLVYPMITERLAINCLKTLETGDIMRAFRRKKSKRRRLKDALSRLPALTPMPLVSCDSSPSTTFSSPLSSNVKNDTGTCPLPVSSASSLASPLNLDLPDETVMEGVEIASRISSPSGTDVQNSPQVKTCSKPGCRYGCICHLCSANESPTPPESFLSRPSYPVCDKEYCRLGCICDSLDPEQPTPSQAHCGKASCMLECVCSDSGIPADGSDDIPFLSSMKQRPRAGERFSNLPRREKTHRTAKNLDAVTRKAMMLYETSEIYCEKAERAKKRECLDSPKPMLKSGSPSETLNQPDPDVIDLEDDPLNFGAASAPFVEHSLIKKRRWPLVSPDVEMPDVLQSLRVVEPSAHKRKRKSHPLSSEIFSYSTCARIQPFIGRRSKIIKLMPDQSDIPVTSSVQLTESSSQCVSKAANTSLGNTMDLKIANVISLATDSKTLHKDEKSNPAFVDLTVNENPKSDNPSPMFSKVPVGLIPLSKIKESGRKFSSSHKPTYADKPKSHHGWHTSMVCLKAKAANRNETPNEDDVQEEDEVKLLEFAADCKWDSAKRAILAQVASCLTRGHYPTPRSMNIGEFVVEILPKAKQPTVIPPELRAKLPEQMYSIRVRITRRDVQSETNKSSHAVTESVIDLSVPSPSKSVSSTSSIPSSSHLIYTDSKSHQASSSKSSSLPSSHLSATSSSSASSSSSSSHIGISGLSKVCVTNSARPPMENSAKSNSAPGSRRSSFDSSKDVILSSGDDTTVPMSVHTKNAHSLPITSVAKSSGKMPVRLLNSSEMKSSGNVNSLKLGIQNPSAATSESTSGSFPPDVQSVKLSPHASLLKRTTVVTTASKIQQTKLQTPSIISAPKPLVKAVNAKEVRYVGLQLPNKEQLMVYEVDTKSNKKTLIAVPLSLANKSGDMKGKPILTVPVPGQGQQKMLPLLAPKSQSGGVGPAKPLFVKIPNVSQSVAVPSEKPPKSRSLISIVPVSSLQNTPNKPLNISNKSVPVSLKSISAQGITISSGMAENKYENNSSQNIHNPISNIDSNNTKTDNVLPSTSVTQSRDRPIPSSVVSGAVSVNENVPCSDSSSSKTETPKEKGLNDEGPSPKLISLLSPALSIKSSSTDGDTGYDKPTQVDMTNGSSSQSKASTLPQDSSSEKTTLVNSTSVKTLERHKVSQEALSPGSEQNVVHHSDRGIAKASSSSLQPECISDDECFSGFSVMQDISYSSLSSQNQTSVQPTNKDVSSFAHETSRHGSQNESSESHHKNGTKVEASSTSVASNLESMISPSNEVRKITEGISGGRSSADIPSTSFHNALKRSVPHSDLEDVSEAKRRRSIAQSLPLTEDDSIPNSAASPHSSCGRSKSGLSSVLSSCSNDDSLVNLSSEEEIDVGEDLPVEAFPSCELQAYKSLENDHEGMFSKPSSRSSPSGMTLSLSAKGYFHKYLERARRAKQKALLCYLRDTVLSVPTIKDGLGNITDVAAMSKVMILDSAKKSIMYLSKVLLTGQREISQLTAQNESLKKELQTVKANLLAKNVSGHTITAIVNQATCQAKKNKETIAVQCSSSGDEVDGVCSQDSVDAVNLVSPSSEENEDDMKLDVTRNDTPKPKEKTASKHDPEERTVPMQETIWEDAVVKHKELCNNEPMEHVEKNKKSVVSQCVGIKRDASVAEQRPVGSGVEVDNSPVGYEDISDCENSTCPTNEQGVQYEDITDEEYGS